MLSETNNWITTALLACFFAVFNVLAVLVILLDKKLRSTPSNCFILSFLCGSALQGFVASPLYIFKKLAFDDNVPAWLCDVSRFTYFYTGHVTKVSFLLIAIDRFVAVRHPYKYVGQVTCQLCSMFVLVAWVFTLTIDVIPFHHNHSEADSCHYIPHRIWGFFVIIGFTILPFVVIFVCYSVIWKISANLSIHDRQISLNFVQPLTRDEKLSESNRSRIGRAKSKSEVLLAMKATRTSLIVVLVYLFCWGPLGVFFAIDHFCCNCLSDRKDLDKTRAGIKFLSATSSIFSPIIYCWLTETFRQAAKRIVRRIKTALCNVVFH